MYSGSMHFYFEFSIAKVTELSYSRIDVKTTSLDQYVDEARYSRVVIPVSSGSGSPFHQHLLDFTPPLEQKLEQELLLDRVGIIREGNMVGQILASPPNPDQEGLSRSSGNIEVRGRPAQQKFGRTRSINDGIQQRCPPTALQTMQLKVLDMIAVGVVLRVV
jgi:hypothetical protein